MEKDFFENLRKVGASVDQRIADLQATWKMPHLLLCKNNVEDQQLARKLIDTLRNELKLLKSTVEENKAEVLYLRRTHVQLLEESTKAIKNLKEEMDDIKILFAENGYIEDSMDNDLSILNSQLESLSVNSSESVSKNSSSVIQSSMFDNVPLCDSNMTKDSFNQDNSTSDLSFNSVQKQSFMNDRPIEPTYSPYFYNDE